MTDKAQKTYIAIDALQPGNRDQIVDIPISSSTALKCRFIALSYLVTSLIERKTITLISEQRKELLKKYKENTLADERVNSVKATVDMLRETLSDEELRQVCGNSDRLRLDEVEDENKNIRFVLRKPIDYSNWDRDTLLDRMEKECIAEVLIAMEMPIWDNYLPEWYGLSDEELKKLNYEDRQFRRRQMIDVEQSRRRDQMIKVSKDNLYTRLLTATSQLEAQEEVSKQIGAIRLWAATRDVDNRDKHFFSVSQVSSLKEALDNPKHVYSEIMRILKEDEVLFGIFARAYSAYVAGIELTGTDLEEAAKEPFRTKLSENSGENTSTTLSADAV